MGGNSLDRRLRQFLAVAEAGNVSLAAEKLNISQPTVSVNMRRLEEEHGVQFFTRSSRGVQLTDYGKVLYEHVKVMARLDQHAAAEIQLLKTSRQKAMRIGTGFAWWSIFMRDIMNAYRHDHTNISIHVDVCSSLDGLRNLLSGDIACFVGTKVAKLDDSMGFVFEELFSVEDAYFARMDHPLSGAARVHTDLSHYPRLDVAPFVNRHLGIIERADFDPTLASQSLSKMPQYSTNSVTAGIDILQDTDAILTYPIVFNDYLRRHGIEAIDVTDRPKKWIAIGLYRLSEKEPDHHLGEILNHIRRATKAIELEAKT